MFEQELETLRVQRDVGAASTGPDDAQPTLEIPPEGQVEVLNEEREPRKYAGD
jgi:hypothetical protein